MQVPVYKGQSLYGPVLKIFLTQKILLICFKFHTSLSKIFKQRFIMFQIYRPLPQNIILRYLVTSNQISHCNILLLFATDFFFLKEENVLTDPANPWSRCKGPGW